MELRPNAAHLGVEKRAQVLARREPADSRRPLVLGAGLKARVDTDGPALRVRAPGRAETRYPLARVSRVVAGLHVDWTAGALRACLEVGIPVVMVGGDGAPLGFVYPVKRRESSLSACIEELLDRPEGREAYGNWLRATRMRMLAEWREARESAGAPVAPGEFAELVRRHVYLADSPFPEGEGAGLWRGALCALAAEAIHRAGLEPAYWAAAAEPLDLLGDLRRLLELRLRLEVSAGMEPALEGERAVLRVFHAISEKLDAEGARCIALLGCRVRRALAEWR